MFKLIENENNSIPIILVGNKTDLVSKNKIEYYKQEWELLQKKISNSNNVVEHFFVSSKNLEGISELFQKCQEILLNNESKKK